MADVEQVQGPSRTRRAVVVAAAVILALAAFSLLMTGLGALLGERGHFGPSAVAKVRGGLVLYLCDGSTIESVDIQRGRSFDGPSVWTATRTGGGLKVLPVRPNVKGYSVRALGPLNGQLAVRSLRNALGAEGSSSYIVFRPAEMSDGSVVDNKGKTQPLASWLADSRC